jgi:hypothetical protein
MYIYVLTALHTSQEQQRVRGRFCCSYSLGCRGSQKNLPKARFKQSHSKGSLLFLTTRPPVAIASRVFSDPLQHYQAVAIASRVFSDPLQHYQAVTIAYHIACLFGVGPRL